MTHQPRLLDPVAMARWERYRAGGRSHFVWRYGVVGFGVPMAVVAVVYKLVQEQGLNWSLVMSTHLRLGIAVAVVAFPLFGYFFGGRLWDSQEESYGRTIERHRPGRGRAR